ncbi:tigger transposable element-derived protein [Elysia marginata]|uniref:Tigger transposable element-derived protein n=1 Tax=Elysia marginata TaxID=1093978 RepID=A0AAV4FXT6_9GAST|nr:tigger transposable element-derived protein [Elysia marginata]
MAGRKLTILPLKRKIELIKAVEIVESGKKQKVVADEFQIPANSVSTIMKRKEHYRQQFYLGQVDVNKQRARLANHDDVETELLKGFTETRGNNIPISGPMMKIKATSIAEAFGKNNWECNEGWLARFKRRHNIVFKTLCGESSSVDDSLNQWRDSVLKKTLSKYEPFDVNNADGTGLFWRLLPNKKMDFKGQECHGGKAPKDRITVLTCANMDGSHKLPLFVIGKFKTPRCFKGVCKLPVEYQANSKAWMTAGIFTEWLQEFDKMMCRQKRKVLLTLDNCTAHPKVDNLKAVELLLLPPNTTSKSQPCDMDIINNLKCHYRGTLLKRIINHVDEGNDFDHFKLTLLDAVIILKQAWEKVEPATIRNCFKKAGLQASETETEGENEIEAEALMSSLSCHVC